MNDDADNVETATEAGGRHRGCPVLRTVNEDDDFIVFHNDLVEHDTISRNQKELKAHPHPNRVVCHRGDCRRDR